VAAPITTGDFNAALFPRNVSELIFEDVALTSVVQQLARRVNLPDNGTTIPVTTGKPTAGWVAEGDAKPVSDAGLGIKVMEPKKLAVIVPFSEEYVRRDATGLFQAIRPQIAEAFADAFDAAAIHGTSSPFTNNIAQTTKTVELGTTTAANGGVWGDLVAGFALLVDDRKRLTGWAADPMAEPVLLGSVDANGRPILVDTNSEGLQGRRLLGRPIGFSEGVSTPAGTSTLRMVGGDWSKVAYGIGRDITYSVSNEATLDLGGGTTLNLWQNNMVALRAEAEYGLVIADTDAFVEFTDAA
jgi:HK97 family phage major capsid protein